MSEHPDIDPMRALERLGALRAEAETAVASAASSEEIEALRVRFLGRKAELTQILRSIASLPADQRAELGKQANEARESLERLIEERGRALESTELERRLEQDRIDVTLPGDPPVPTGHLHLLTTTRRE